MLLVDDEAVMLRALARVFARAGWTCERAASPLVALDLLGCRAVDAIVADFRMQPFDGVELCVRARSAGFPGPIVIYTGCASPALRESAVCAGAWAVVPKATSAQALALQLRTHCDGCARARQPTPARDLIAAARAYARAHGLSPRETQILEHALAGEVRKQCAAHIGCSPGSVATYWRRIFEKTSQSDREGVVRDVLAFVIDSTGRTAH